MAIPILPAGSSSSDIVSNSEMEGINLSDVYICFKKCMKAAAAAPSSYVTRVVYKRLAGKWQERKQIIAALARRWAPKVYEELQAARINEHAGAAVKEKDENLGGGQTAA